MPTNTIDNLTIEELRDEFRRMRRNAASQVNIDEWLASVRGMVPTNPTPADWVYAAQYATIRCERCDGSGHYSWGASINGKMSHGGPCYRCEGKGCQGQDDFRRNWAYDRYAVVAAYRGMIADGERANA